MRRWPWAQLPMFGAILTGVILVAATSHAAEEIFYWKDANGVFHYRTAPKAGWRNLASFGRLEADAAGTEWRARGAVRSLPTSSSIRERYDPLIEKYSAQYEVDPALVKAVIHVESNFDPRARSRHGASGLMQLMPRTARKHGVSDLFHPDQNIRGGVRELRRLLDRFESRSLTWALAAYNAGVGAVVRHGGVPPYGETRRFVKKVLRLRRIYQQEAQIASR